MTPRTTLSHDGWRALAAAPGPALIGLWADTREVHALFEGAQLMSVPVVEGAYPALSAGRPGAAGFERAVHDLWGHMAEGGDPRPWFQTGGWPVMHPMSARPQPAPGRAEPEEPAPVPEDRHVLLSGPVRAPLSEPALVRANTDGRLVDAAEVRLGWAHKGTALLMRSKSPRAAARFAARVQADSTVAHSLAFARAAEDASGAAVPPRADALRLLMTAVEAVTAMLAELAPTPGPALDAIRRACAAAFGHRLMMDCVTPGGVLADLAPEGARALRTALDTDMVGAFAPHPAESALEQMESLPPGPLSTPLPVASAEGLGHAPTPRGTVWHWVRLDNGTVANAFACDPAPLAWGEFAAGLEGRELTPEGLPADAPWLRVSGADL